MTLSSDKKVETDYYAHFLYKREIVFCTKYPVKVRILAEDLILLRKVKSRKNRKIAKNVEVAPTGPRQSEQVLRDVHGCARFVRGLEALPERKSEGRRILISSNLRFSYL